MAVATSAAAAACSAQHEGGERGAEAMIRRVEPLGMHWQTLDPFLFCAHHNDRYPAGNAELGPRAALDGRLIGQDFSRKDGWSMYHGESVPGFPQHPHRGFETVSLVRRGLMDHADSLGATARFGGGDVQWLTAGSGILHSEMFPLLDREKENPLELFQVWLNLPAAKKMVAPYFSMLWKEAIPVHREGKVEVTLVAGELGGKSAPQAPPDSWASDPENDVAIWSMRIAAGGSFTLPAARAGTNRALYFYLGDKLRVAGRAIPEYHMVVVDAAQSVALEAESDVEILMLQGRPIGEPVVKHGPFVMNSKAEILQAIRDYQSTEFGGWPWPRHDPVHPADEGRVARHAGGKTERPSG